MSDLGANAMRRRPTRIAQNASAGVAMRPRLVSHCRRGTALDWATTRGARIWRNILVEGAGKTQPHNYPKVGRK